MTTDDNILYEPDERCPPLVSLAVGFQGAVILLIATVLVVSITLEGDSHGGEYLTWAVFIALIINGASTALQAGSIWRFGAGHVFFTNTLATYMPVSRIALANGGPALMASLVVVSSLVHFPAIRMAAVAAPDSDAGGVRDRSPAGVGDDHTHRLRLGGRRSQ